MKTRKQIISFVAALATLTAITGASAFAASLSGEDKQVKEQPVIADEVAETEEADDAAEAETTVAEDASEATETEAAETDETKPAAPAEIEDGEKPEPPAGPAEGVKPVGKREIAELVAEVFDTEAMDFKSDEAKAAWFEFVEMYLNLDNEPVPPVAPAELEDGEKPEPPTPPAGPAELEDGEKPEPPTPPAGPAEDGEKPEPPTPPAGPIAPPEGPAAHHHVGPAEATDAAAETVEETTTVADAE